MPLVETYGMIKSGQYVTDISILGITKEQAEQFGITLAEGEMPGAGGATTYEIALGAWTLQNFYNADNYRQAMKKLASGRGNLLAQAESFRSLGVEVKREINPDLVEQATAQDEEYRLRGEGDVQKTNNTLAEAHASADL